MRPVGGFPPQASICLFFPILSCGLGSTTLFWAGQGFKYSVCAVGKLEDGKGAIFEGQSFFKEHFWFGSGDNGFKEIHYPVYGR